MVQWHQGLRPCKVPRISRFLRQQGPTTKQIHGIAISSEGALGLRHGKVLPGALSENPTTVMNLDASVVKLEEGL